MRNETSFMEVIDNFDNILKHPNVTEEIRQYAEALKNIFIRIEEANVIFSENISEIIKEDNILN